MTDLCRNWQPSAAVDLNLLGVVGELGQAEVLGSQLLDPLDNVPEVMPVTRLKVNIS